MKKEDFMYLVLISGLTYVYVLSMASWIRKSKEEKEKKLCNCPKED